MQTEECPFHGLMRESLWEFWVQEITRKCGRATSFSEVEVHAYKVKVNAMASVASSSSLEYSVTIDVSVVEPTSREINHAMESSE